MATILRRFEHRAGVVAPTGYLQLVRARSGDIPPASDRSGAPVRRRPEFHRHVEPLEYRDVVVVLVPERVEPVLGEGVRRRSVRLAPDLAVAVSGEAAAAAGGVEGAVGSSPDLGEFGTVGEADGPGLARVEAAPSAGDGGWPDGVGAVVLDVEDDSVGLEEEDGEERENDGFGEIHF